MESYEQTITGGSEIALPGGKHLFVLDASADLDITAFGEKQAVIGTVSGVGQGFKVSFEERIPLSIKIQSSTTQAVKIGISNLADIDYNILGGNINTEETSPDTVTTYADLSCTGSAKTKILDADTDRVEAFIQNPIANSHAFKIGDTNAGSTRGLELIPGATLVLTTSAEIYAYNLDTSAQDIIVAETKRS